jgi:hypothetical protein
VTVAPVIGRAPTTRMRWMRDDMAEDFLGDRRAGLENAFFAQQDALLRRRLAEMDEAKAKKADLASASGIQDAAVLDKLMALNIGGATLAALSLVPLVVVAWADGALDDKERNAILAAAEQSGLGGQDAAFELLKGWLARKPPPELAATWKAYVSALSPTLSEDARRSLKANLLDRARAVAEAAGGFMGLGRKVSDAERVALEELERAF